MRRSSAAILFCSALLAGCGGGRERVYVNVEQALAIAAEPPVNLPQVFPPAALPAKTVTLPPVPGSSMTVGSGPDVLLASRQKAERELTRSLIREYLDEVDRDAGQLLGGVEPRRRQVEGEAQQRIRAAFEAYAAERAPKVARLASIVGFPDPNPRSVPPARPVPAPVQQLLDEAAALRRAIAELDQAYEARVRAILGEVEERYELELTNLRAEIASRRSAAVVRAEREAMRRTREAYQVLEQSLLRRQTVTLPGQPASSATLPAIPAPPPPPQVERRILSGAERRKILDEQLRVWSASRGYELTMEAGAGRDATAEFIQWRKERRL